MRLYDLISLIIFICDRETQIQNKLIHNLRFLFTSKSVFHECLLQMYNPIRVILWIEKRIQSLTVGIWSVPSFYYYYYWRYNSTLQMHRGITKDVLKFYSMKFSSAFNNIWFGHDVKMLYPFIQWTIQGNGFNKRLLATDLQISNNDGKNSCLKNCTPF